MAGHSAAVARRLRCRTSLVSYLPGDGETLGVVVGLLVKVLPDKAGPVVFGGLVRRGGQVAVHLLFFSPSKVSVTGLLNQDSWLRKGARGRVFGLQWPEAPESSGQFLERWAGFLVAVPDQVGTVGSKESLLQAWNEYRALCRVDERESQRLYRERQRQRERQMRRLDEFNWVASGGLSEDGDEGAFEYWYECSGAIVFPGEEGFDPSDPVWTGVDFSEPVRGFSLRPRHRDAVLCRLPECVVDLSRVDCE
jgi:hypothetical protein